MGHSKSLSLSPRGKWLVLLLRLHVMFCGVKSEGQAQTTASNPAPGLLCISECYTCPEICSPPPAPPQWKPPILSPPVHSSPPPQSYFYKSPPPPQSYVYESPPPPRRSPPPPPSQPYISWGSNPPPPPPGYTNIPTVQAPPNGGNRNYTYPYYYFYASKANSISPLLSLVGMVLLSFSIVMVCWQEGK
ncbi:hypothetical protein RHGRI_020915 [Rhododendron griersonianum]|uniref:Uncharacterized protein n=1 Tax=Rhododendron griersonianum TaxID=479676 RepID=A0AAV6JLE5_9ERIC|nr:hypothetical protein RHGRI_020915 [Rhododendron griersonianum]